MSRKCGHRKSLEGFLASRLHRLSSGVSVKQQRHFLPVWAILRLWALACVTSNFVTIQGLASVPGWCRLPNMRASRVQDPGPHAFQLPPSFLQQVSPSGSPVGDSAERSLMGPRPPGSSFLPFVSPQTPPLMPNHGTREGPDHRLR